MIPCRPVLNALYNYLTEISCWFLVINCLAFSTMWLSWQRNLIVSGINLEVNLIYTNRQCKWNPNILYMPQNCTMDVKGATNIKIVSTGYEKQHITLMLCVTADDWKLPHLILKHKIINFSYGWITIELMEDWLHIVWNRWQEI